MFKVLLAFLLIFGLFFFGFTAVRKLSGLEALALTKIVGYSILCAVLSIAVLTGIVILF